jgi:hypothetical protein
MSYDEPFGHECGEGWKTIIDDTHKKLKYIDPDYKIVQIKEKFGGLRYYYDNSFESYNDIRREIMDDIILSAENKASYTCELCGANGWGTNVQIRVHSCWYFGYCQECADKTIKERDSWAVKSTEKEYGILTEI